MKRIICILAIVISIATVFGGVGAYASYDGESLTRGASFCEVAEVNTLLSADIATDNSPLESDTAADNADAVLDKDDGEYTSSGEYAESTENESENGEVNNYNSSANEDANESDATGKNPFESAFEVVKAYAAEILCALTFVGSLVLAYAYKRGLIPLLTNGISAISGAVSRIKESAERGEGKTDALSKIVFERLTDAESCLDGIGKSLIELEERLDDIKADKNEGKLLRTVMSAQIDMLYSIFMTSQLPQYQKDEVGERIAKMKEALATDEGE